MKKYNEFKYELGNDENGNRAWINPVLVRENLSMEERYANDLNEQFVNSGIMYAEEIVEGEVLDAPNGINAGEQLGAGNPPAAPALENTGGAPQPEPPVIPAQPVVEATPEPAITPLPEAPAAAENENTEGRV